MILRMQLVSVFFVMQVLAERSELELELDEQLPVDQRLGIESRVPTMIEALKPLYVALPKNEHNKLAHGTVRYALYRLFRQTHAWLVKGLTPSGQAWSASSSLSDALESKMPQNVADVFEKHLDETGFNLEEAAFLAATLEELIFQESIERLKIAYGILKLPLEGALAWDQVSQALEVYMMEYLYEGNFDASSPDDRARVKEVYPNWPATQRFIRKQMREATHKAEGELEFVEAENVVTLMSKRFGHWQDIECRELKHTLLAYESSCQGRVDLGDFHGSAAGDGKWQFSESEDYLRQLGALDEQKDKRPSVIVPNYVDSPSNYLGSSETYSTVCLDECWTLMSQLERTIAAPFATPAKIINTVKGFTTSENPEPRVLPAYLLRHLESIAKFHGGIVPLHGRLFAQWMHHLFPRECQYPFFSGAAPMLPYESQNKTGLKVMASPEDMAASEQAMNEALKASPLLHKIHESCLPWNMQEELLAPLDNDRRYSGL
eukprot:TRINITY_DN25130_c0_g1_i1.p1 TRINITY_DN25130_c0_g1~~TRINITY_DN25130_c0_g1_i1.p1  ORF type:complete len:492 (-),score=88.25 TRINITY_DN25130_c0_g1_i1:32-1507(-)